MIAEDRWDLIIKSNGPLWSLDLKELWRYRDLIYLFTRRDLVAFYKQTILGPLWIFIQPVFTALVYALVFGQIAKLSTDGAPQILFYLSGITLWNYFADCFNKTASVFRDNSNLFGKVYFPRIVIPLSIVLSNLVRFSLQFILFLTLLSWFLLNGQVRMTAAVALLPFTILIIAVMALAAGMIFSALTTKYRDLVFLLQFGVQLLMYATPVIYPVSQVPQKLVFLLRLNPLTPLFEATRYGYLGSGELSLLSYCYTAAFTAIMFSVAVLVFNRVERNFMDTV